jgi:predicted DCC family thiol-disulfide oxidoreductase YuxK
MCAPRARPLLVYDGECGFCTWWVRRWQARIGARVDFAPFQEVAAEVPEIPIERFRAAVQLVDTDGSVYAAAEAVLRTVALAPGRGWALWTYLHVPGFATFAGWCYRCVARHRGAAAAITRFAWGRRPEPATYFVARWLFLRLVALAYAVAFVSLGVQVRGLIGAEGIAPAGEFLDRVAARFGPERFQLLPTVCWWNASDAFLIGLCAAGASLALFVFLDIASALALALMWIGYLSLVGAGQDFLAFQWDILLLEAGFLACFLAPMRLRPGRSAAVAYSNGALRIAWWLGFRLTLASGAVKLLSGDPSWHHLTALEYHYETQPLPTWIGWWAHQLPARFQQASCLMMFVIELGGPFLILMPVRLRRFAFSPLVGLQLLIAATGNYCFFNLLAVALYVLLVDDAAWPAVLRRWLRLPADGPGLDAAGAPPARSSGMRRRLAGAVLVALGGLSTLRLAETFGLRPGGPVAVFGRSVEGLHIANRYGLFAVMTTVRREIVVEGSDDGTTWHAYEFKHKPGDLRRRPGFVEPHQPRLDWQMWFAALSSYEKEPWFIGLCARLLRGEPSVLALLETNPFPERPPRQVRALAYRYHFTDVPTRRAEGTWWRRELEGTYCPVLSNPRPRPRSGR